MPCKINCQAFCNNSPAKITVLVVPSLAILSWVDDALIIIFATGCSTLAVSRTVTPSFVTKVRPSSSISSLSNPFGPSVERIASDKAMAAWMFFCRASLPLERVVSLRIGASLIARPQPSKK